ncbi:methyltransferase domain-containing protein [bacterium]|jgi:hypothetical protein|nr:methyltransferase domain-containing protein [bacterium]
MKKNNCRVCCGNEINLVLEFDNIPNSMDLREDDNSNHTTINLPVMQCQSCGFVFINETFSENELYTEHYAETSTYPPNHIDSLVKRTISMMGNKQLELCVDIGSNNGYFLEKFSSYFDTLLGVEPGSIYSTNYLSNNMSIVDEYFNSSLAIDIVHKHGLSDLITCRHVIEHINELDDFFDGINYLLNDHGLLVLEVPDFNIIMNRGDFMSIWEQHINYFELQTLKILLGRNGLLIESHECVSNGGGSLVLFVRKMRGDNLYKNNYSNDFNDLHASFVSKMEHNINKIQSLMYDFSSQGKIVVMYGAGNKGNMLVNLSGIGQYLYKVLDDNSNKQGQFLPGSSIPIAPSSELLDSDVCIIPPMTESTIVDKIIKKNMNYISQGGIFVRFFGVDDFIEIVS